jgi:hypothetical protein
MIVKAAEIPCGMIRERENRFSGRSMPSPSNVAPSPLKGSAVYVRIGTEAWRKNGLRACDDFWQGDPR